MPSKEFHQIIEQMKTIHDKKSHDYAADNDPFSNFTFASDLAKLFTNDRDKAFTVLIGIKLARLAELLSTGKEANNESIDDTFIDLANYCVLWGAFYRSKKINEIEII